MDSLGFFGKSPLPASVSTVLNAVSTVLNADTSEADLKLDAQGLISYC